MNIEDVKNVKVPDGCRLDFLFKHSARTLKAYGRPVKVNIHTREGQALLREFAWYTTEELGEAINCLKNRPWTHTESRVDLQHFDDEIADFVHFAMQFLTLAGYDVKKLLTAYLKKVQVNDFRRESGY